MDTAAWRMLITAVCCASATVGAAAPGPQGRPVLRVQAVEVEERVIYHSPETPGITAWVGLWQLPDGAIQCNFEQITHEGGPAVYSFPVLETRDGARTWTRVGGDIPRGMCWGMAVLPDGTMVRPVQSQFCKAGGAEDAGGYVQRSTDGGSTWSEPVYVLSPTEYCAWPWVIRRLRDGRLVLFAGCARRSDRPAMLRTMVKMMFVSSDEGRTWSAPIVLVPPADGVCEESDFCELPNGDLYWVHRAEVFGYKPGSVPPLAETLNEDVYYDRLKSIVRKANGAFVPERPTRMGVTFSGCPCLLPTREGLFIDLTNKGSNWSDDQGETWHKLLIADGDSREVTPLAVKCKEWLKLSVENGHLMTLYYPKALQLADGRILCLSHLGSDSSAGRFDMAIVQQTFRLKVEPAGE
jgi:hypothetical protein